MKRVVSAQSAGYRRFWLEERSRFIRLRIPAAPLCDLIDEVGIERSWLADLRAKGEL